MAHIRTHDTERRKNKVVNTYGVVWREPDRDQFGLPIPINPDDPRGRSDARLVGDLLSAARHMTGTSALAEQKRRGVAVWVRHARLARRAGGEGQPGEAHMPRTVKPPPGPGRPLTDQLVSRAVAARVYESTRR